MDICVCVCVCVCVLRTVSVDEVFTNTFIIIIILHSKITQHYKYFN